MVYEKRFNALVIDPVADSRATLKKLLHNEQLYNRLVYHGVYIVASLSDAVPRLYDGEEDIDVVFISCRFSSAKIERFIQESKAHDSSDRGIAYIMLLDDGDNSGAAVAQGMAYGGDGFLTFPCSVEQLREVTLIAQKIKAAAQERMLTSALILLVNTLLKEVKAKVLEQYKTGNSTSYRKFLKLALPNLVQDRQPVYETYIELLLRALENALPSSKKEMLEKEKPPWSRQRAKRTPVDFQGLT